MILRTRTIQRCQGTLFIRANYIGEEVRSVCLLLFVVCFASSGLINEHLIIILFSSAALRSSSILLLLISEHPSEKLFLSFPQTMTKINYFLTALALLASNAVLGQNVVQHPDEHPWISKYLHVFSVPIHEQAVVKACEMPSHSCDWVFMVLYRDESCVPEDLVVNTVNEDEGALNCPLVVEGYSVYETEDTSGWPNKYHLTSVPGVDVRVYLLPRAKLQELERKNPDYTYGEFFTWEEDQKDVHRGFATEYSELHYLNLNDDVEDEGDFYLVANGFIEDGRAFSIKIQEEGDAYIPVIWDIDIEPASTSDDDSSDDDDDDGLEEGALAGVIVAAFVVGALLGAFAMMLCSSSRKSQDREAEVTHPVAVAEAKHKEMEPTESAHD